MCRTASFRSASSARDSIPGASADETGSFVVTVPVDTVDHLLLSPDEHSGGLVARHRGQRGSLLPENTETVARDGASPAFATPEVRRGSRQAPSSPYVRRDLRRCRCCRAASPA